MKILSIDTTADVCSIALSVENSSFVFHEERPREHAKILLPEIEKLFVEAGISAQDLELIVFGRGPGSFTGVRIATGVAQGLALASGCKLIPISTLQSLAWRAAKDGHKDIWVSLDARMSEVYFARYQVNADGVPKCIVDECVLPPKNIEEVPGSKSFFIGNGWLTPYDKPENIDSLKLETQVVQLLPNALDSAELAIQLYETGVVQAVEPEDAQPIYLRDNVTWDNKPKVGS